MNSQNQSQPQNALDPLSDKVWLFTNCYAFESEMQNELIDKGYEPFAAFLTPVPQAPGTIIQGGKQQMQMCEMIFFKRQVTREFWNQLKAENAENAAKKAIKS